MAEHWYCLYTKPQKEPQVAGFCSERLNLATYFPRLRHQRTIRRKKQSVTSPLFPRYIFCRFDASVSYRAVRFAPDVSTIVSAGGAPVVVAQELIETLKQWAGDEVDIITLRPSLQAGAAVEVIAGPLQGLSGKILENEDEQERVRVLLHFLHCGANITLDRSEIRLIA